MTHVTPDDPLCALLAGRLTEPGGVERLMADVRATAAENWLADMEQALFRLRDQFGEATSAAAAAHRQGFLTIDERDAIEVHLESAWKVAFAAQQDREAGE